MTSVKLGDKTEARHIAGMAVREIVRCGKYRPERLTRMQTKALRRYGRGVSRTRPKCDVRELLCLLGVPVVFPGPNQVD